MKERNTGLTPDGIHIETRSGGSLFWVDFEVIGERYCLTNSVLYSLWLPTWTVEANRLLSSQKIPKWVRDEVCRFSSREMAENTEGNPPV